MSDNAPPDMIDKPSDDTSGDGKPRKPARKRARKTTSATKKGPAPAKTDAPRSDQEESVQVTASPGSGEEVSSLPDTSSPAAAPRRKRSRGKSSPAKPQSSEAAQDVATPEKTSSSLIRVPLSVRWRDLDAFNHVNNAKYLGYLEEARLRWMLQIPGQGMDDQVAPVVAAASVNYRRPITWPAEISIKLFVERLGNTSLTVGHRIVDAQDDGVLYCDGNVVLVWIDRESGAAAPLPSSVRAACD